MPATGKDGESSVSGNFDDSDVDSHADSPNLPGKPGRKKNPNSQAARRDQNRIAQREFRLRKQQRIRDLEARVEILSGGKDEVVGEMRNILKDLMQENQTLRSLLRGLGSFIGDGVGGILPKLGWDVTDFNDFVNRSETDTAWESYQRRKKAQSGPPNIGSVSQNIRGQKRSAEEDTIASRPKKSRGPGDLDHDERGQDDYSLLVPMNSGITPIPPKPNMYTPRSNEGAFADLMRGSVEPMFVPTPSSATPSSQYRPPSPHSTYRNSYLPPISMNVEGQLSSLPFSSSNTQQRKPNNGLPSDQAAAEEEAKTDEALKLILYHVNNYNRNSAYCLPSSLRSTLVQRTIPHDGVIDGIIHPELRDRMILLRDRFDLAECLVDYRLSVTIHGDDVLSHINWEIGEKWLRRYGSLIDQSTLNIANRWRRERGEPELRLDDLVPSDGTSAST